MSFFQNWVPNDLRSQNSSSLHVWIDASNTESYDLSGSVRITDATYGSNPIIQTINNLGTLGGSFTRVTLEEGISVLKVLRKLAPNHEYFKKS